MSSTGSCAKIGWKEERNLAPRLIRRWRNRTLGPQGGEPCIDGAAQHLVVQSVPIHRMSPSWFFSSVAGRGYRIPTLRSTSIDNKRVGSPRNGWRPIGACRSDPPRHRRAMQQPCRAGVDGGQVSYRVVYRLRRCSEYTGAWAWDDHFDYHGVSQPPGSSIPYLL